MSLRSLCQLLYGLLFIIALPVALVWWTRQTSAAVTLPIIQSDPGGVALVLGGVALVCAGWYGLIVDAGGLPMNAFPPARYVRKGVYRWLRNPIYIGFGLVCAGVSIAAGSPSGFWLVTPIAILSATALVFGFERGDLVRRFGLDALRPPLLSIPPDDEGPPALRNRIAVFVWVLVPALLARMAAQMAGRAPDVFDSAFAFERRWPVWPRTELLHFSAYVFVIVTVLAISSSRALRRFAVAGAIATVIVTFCWYIVPTAAAPRTFLTARGIDDLLTAQGRWTTDCATFPAALVVWSLLAATAWTEDARTRRAPVLAWVAWAWAGATLVSCITTGRHSLLDVCAAVLLFVVIRRPEHAWTWIHDRVEALANFWHEWRIGSVRVINHAIFAACAAGAGFAIMATALPAERFGDAVVVTLCIVLAAGIWAQLLEGSSVLLRPFGWFGGVVGAFVGVALTSGSWADAVPLGASLALAAPWIQAIGRLRCLVQGCCHGGPAPAWLGIRYVHRRSRVASIAGLAGQPIHPTPLYSIACNVLIGVIVLRLRLLATPDTMVIGLYFILSGIARFIEEAYRAEPQTAVVGGLRMYQWLAVASVLGGIWSTTVASVTTSAGFGPLSLRIVAMSLLVGAIAGSAMGVDFPRSSWRFSRLAPVD